MSDLQKFQRLASVLINEISTWRRLVSQYHANRGRGKKPKVSADLSRQIEQAVVRHNDLLGDYREAMRHCGPIVRAAHAPALIEWDKCDGTYCPYLNGEPKPPATMRYASHCDALLDATEERHMLLSRFSRITATACSVAVPWRGIDGGPGGNVESSP